ncbi:hypothetical protein DWUX_1997 [Desulfovibrio diazotrophicus]|nr:hypothetical protein DWUX_1997 [Desulfovibrio diazotrophicus]
MKCSLTAGKSLPYGTPSCFDNNASAASGNGARGGRQLSCVYFEFHFR